MKRLWLVFNASSGSTSAALIDELEKACARYEIAGRSDFPAETCPDTAQLDGAGVDTLVIFGGDGTINAATQRLDDWSGTCLVLPGGTMNGLAKTLHGDADWTKVLERAPGGQAERLPIACSGDDRGLVGVIIGPAASWFHAREAVRAGAYAKLGRALRYAMRKTFARTVRVVGGARHRAVIVTPQAEDLEIAAISTDSWFAGAKLGWDWLLGDWRRGADVSVTHASSISLVSSRPITALFDGEPVKLASPVTVTHALTNLRFMATRAA